MRFSINKNDRTNFYRTRGFNYSMEQKASRKMSTRRVKHWFRELKEAVASPLLVVFKNRLDSPLSAIAKSN